MPLKFKRWSDQRHVLYRNQFYKTELCKFWQTQSCVKGSSCPFAHGNDELNTVPDLRKTCICEDWKRGVCMKPSAKCAYAHGQAELRSTQAFLEPEAYEPGNGWPGFPFVDQDFDARRHPLVSGFGKGFTEEGHGYPSYADPSARDQLFDPRLPVAKFAEERPREPSIYMPPDAPPPFMGFKSREGASKILMPDPHAGQSEIWHMREPQSEGHEANSWESWWVQPMCSASASARLAPSGAPGSRITPSASDGKMLAEAFDRAPGMMLSRSLGPNMIPSRNTEADLIRGQMLFDRLSSLPKAQTVDQEMRLALSSTAESLEHGRALQSSWF